MLDLTRILDKQYGKDRQIVYHGRNCLRMALQTLLENPRWATRLALSVTKFLKNVSIDGLMQEGDVDALEIDIFFAWLREDELIVSADSIRAWIDDLTLWVEMSDEMDWRSPSKDTAKPITMAMVDQRWEELNAGKASVLSPAEERAALSHSMYFLADAIDKITQDYPQREIVRAIFEALNFLSETSFKPRASSWQLDIVSYVVFCVMAEEGGPDFRNLVIDISDWIETLRTKTP